MAARRVSLYDRLPEIYRQRDQEQAPPGQLQAFLAVLEEILSDVHENIESLYHDLFIDTCEEWVIPYIGDLLGNSHLAGDPWTLRADVADTILLRRRKGTRAAMERLTIDVSGWAASAVELFANLAWTQHLNHQRPDAGGNPPYAHAPLRTVPRGGSAPIRDPATLALLGSPFDPFAYGIDVRPSRFGQLRYNLPNLAILVWRLGPFRVLHSWPVQQSAPRTTGAVTAVRFFVHPLGSRIRLFNNFHYDPDARPPQVVTPDGAPGPIHPARLTSNTPFGVPDKYVGITTWGPLLPLSNLGLGLELQLPDAAFTPFDASAWTFRGANLCAWELGLNPPLQAREVAIDPIIGRLVIGCATAAEAAALQPGPNAGLRITYTYGAPSSPDAGGIGAHPTSSRRNAPATFDGSPTQIVGVDSSGTTSTLAQALGIAATPGAPLVVEVQDSATYDLDPAQVTGNRVEAGGANIQLARALVFRAAAGQRPVIRLAAPLRFRPVTVGTANRALTVVLEALYLTPGPGFDPTDALIARAAVHALEIKECTLDPGGEQQLDPAVLETDRRGPSHTALALTRGYGFADPVEAAQFVEEPGIALWRTVAGPVLVDAVDYTLSLTDSIVDCGGVAGAYAIAGTGPNPSTTWGADLTIDCVTVLGRTRVNKVQGRGGIFVERLEAFDDQTGCLKYCWFSGDSERLPQNYACVGAPDAFLSFTSDRFGASGYGQLSLATDQRVLEQGPGDDEMGAFHYLLNAHRQKNLQIRYREFTPIGVRTLVVPVT
jgi:hypothetical protein